VSSGLHVAILKSRRVASTLQAVEDGGSIHVLKQIEALCLAGHEVDVFTRAESGADRTPRQLACGARLWRVPYEPSSSPHILWRDLAEGRSFVRGVAESPGFAAAAFDVVHVHHWTSGVGLGDYVPDKMPIAFTPHLLASEKARTNGLSLPLEVAHVERALLIRADAVIALSRDEAATCSSLGAVRVEFVPNGVTTEFFGAKPLPRPTIDAIVRLGTVGRICRQKGTDLLLDAVELLRGRGIDVRLDIVGPSYAEDDFEAAIRKRVASPPLFGCVRLTGPVSHLELPSLVQSWDVYLQPSRYESQGIALLEAMAAAKPVIATDLPAVREYLQPGCGILTPPLCTGADIASAVLKLLQTSSWEQLGLAARNAAQPFSWSAATTKLNSAVESIAEASEWHGPREDSAHARELRRVAVTHAAQLVTDYKPAGVLLVGSAARGPVRRGSDIDLVVLQEVGEKVRSDWLFSGSKAFDVRFVPLQRLQELVDFTDEEFAGAITEDALPDILYGAVPLTELERPVARLIAQLQRRRCKSHVATFAARSLAKRALTGFGAASEAARLGFFPDAQLLMNAGVQALLVATLVAEGWNVQGAKRRPEVALQFARRSETVRAAIGLLATTTGVDRITLNDAEKLATSRNQLRLEHLRCVEALTTDAGVLDLARRHAIGATDYYTAAIADGYVKGSINHMRSLSGVPQMPATYAQLLKLDSPFQANSFLDNPKVSSAVKELWLQIMAPHASDSIQVLARRGIFMVGNLLANL